VSFVSPEAQFTPKQVETRSERDKLMFRVKIQVPEELVSSYIERIKTGVRGVGYVKVDPSAAWPDWLENVLAPPAKPGDQTPPGASEPASGNPQAPVSAEKTPAAETGPPSRTD
jgi:HlyD family secretion protein